jgi:excisionase family DNA binding protein
MSRIAVLLKIYANSSQVVLDTASRVWCDRHMTQELALYTTTEVARRFAVDSATVRRWVAKGQLKPAGVTPGGQYRFNAAEIDQLIGAAA